MRNRYIELERFIASCVILLYHLGVSKGSWIMVEFFFMLTGYFTMLHIERKEEVIRGDVWYPISYTWKKFVKLLPYTSISIMLMWVGRVNEWNLTFSEIVKWLMCLPSELLLMAGTGMMPEGLQISAVGYAPRIINGHLWYLCSMLIMLPIVVCLLTYAKRWKSVIVTVVPALLYGILILKDGTVDGWHGEEFSFFFCDIRALAGLLLGAGAYYFSKWWKSREYTILGKVMLTAIEVFSFVIVLVVSFVTSLRFDAFQIGLLFLSISLTNAGVTYTSKITWKQLDFLGAISLPIYCIQMPLFWICSIWGLQEPWVSFVVIILVSIVLEIILTGFGKLFGKYKDNLIGLFVK